MDTQFDLNSYFEHNEQAIQYILSRQVNEESTFDILDTEKSKMNKRVALKEKQRQMKVGEIWQVCLGNYKDCIDLKIGHETGLDLMSHTRKFAVELKNRTNTDNASSKKSNLDKLAKFKLEHPDYTCIYGNINADTEQKTRQTPSKKIIHNGMEIEHQVGIGFLTFILGSDIDAIVDFIRNSIDKYT